VVGLITPWLFGCVARLDELRGTDAGYVEGRGDVAGESVDSETSSNSRSGEVTTSIPSEQTATVSGEDPATDNTTPESTQGVATEADCPTGYYRDASRAGEESCEDCAASSLETTNTPPQVVRACVRYSTCLPGTYVSMPGTTVSDAVCAACPLGTFSAASHAEACLPWSPCAPGQYELVPGTATEDRECAACPAEEANAADGGPFECLTEGPSSCPPGTTRDANACVACATGTFCAGAETAPEACAAETWDHDADPASVCVPKSSCSAGEWVLSPGDRRSDRECATCEEGFFSQEANAAECLPWRRCEAPHEFVSRPPTSTRDRSCSACEAGTAAAEENATSCTADVFAMSNGLVVVEAEHYAHATTSGEHRWSLLQLAGTSGGQCVEVGPDEHYDWTEEAIPTAPRLDFFVNLLQRTTYYVHVRGDAGANSDGFSDSCYVALDGDVRNWLAFNVNGGTWGWETLLIGAVEPGLHTLSILAREDGFRLDKVVISTVAAPPTGDGPPESPLL
jgi:Gylcosyl hydrolase family 115 C-terminal domain/TNFR/NGFR cysteine-rich region